ncbi:hypothetical protein MBLNU459_g1142t1 [Dothideomycetes sp. NU459]
MEVFEKSQTVDPEVRAHVYSLVSAVGGAGISDGKYVLGDDALACLKDIGRWIRLYDDKTDRHDVKRCLAEANLVKGDLLEMLASWPESEQASVLKTKVALQCLDILQRLTWPMEMTEEKAKVNHHRHIPYLRLAQVGYKRAILQHDTAPILRTAIRVVIPCISMPKDQRTSREQGIIDVVLYFLRNIASIAQPHDLPSQGDDNEISRDATINAFHDQDVLHLILTICSSIGDEFQHHDIVIMELLFQLLKGINPNDLFKQRAAVQSDRLQEFKTLLNKEKAMVASYAKNAPTRHHRFGTMIWVNRPDGKRSTLSGQNVIFDEQKTLEKMDKSKVWDKPKQRSKTKEVRDENNDFDAVVHIEEHTREQLRSFVEDFLDSSFNPLFNSLRRSLASESSHVQVYSPRQFYYLSAWFLEAERARQEEIKKAAQANPTQDPHSGDSPFAYIAAVMTQENFVLLSRKIQQSLDDKVWSDLHACIRAFTQILLTVSAMSESSSEDDQDIAENILSRIFYEEGTHDQVIRILREYKDQGFGYLDSCTELAHVFVRMLERYSKQNVDLQIRSKRRARRKRKEKAQSLGENENEGNDAASEAEDEVEAHRASSERKFDFNRYAVKFMTEACIDTFVRFTSYYADLNDEQLKRAHRFFYRCAFKIERSMLLFRVDILHLFNRMIKGPGGLVKDSATFKDWQELVKQLFRRCLKKLDDRRELMVEMLFTKMPATVFYLENGYDMEVKKGKPRPPAELVVKPGMSKDEEIGVAVSVLVNQGKLDALAWVKTVLSSSAEERKAWEDEQEARASIASLSESREGSPRPSTDGDAPKAPSIPVQPDTPERRTDLYKDKFLRLLLVLLAFERLGATDDPDASWIVPSNLSSSILQSNHDLIKRFEFDLPVYADGVSPESLLRNKSAVGLHARADRSAHPSDDEGDSDLDNNLFEPGGPTPWQGEEREKKAGRKRLRRAKEGEEISEEEQERRAAERRRREKERDSKIKSALRITDSDDEDDESRDEEFFRLEEERRKAMRGVIRNALLNEVPDTAGEKKSKARKRKSNDLAATEKGKQSKKRRKTIILSDDDDSDDDIEKATSNVLTRTERPVVLSSDDSEPDSPLHDSELSDVENQPLHPAKSPARPLTESSGNTTRNPFDEDDGDDDDDNDVVLAKPVRRAAGAARAPFIVDSDSE